MHPFVELALETIKKQITKQEKPPLPSPLPDEFLEKAGVFVSIKKFGALRGCIGTIEPTSQNLAEEIIQNAISASIYDSRFAPVEESELVDLTISVDVLSTPEQVESIDELDCKKYGLIVSDGIRRGLLLPNLDGVDSVKSQIEICKRKAGISGSAKVSFKRFTVTRYK